MKKFEHILIVSDIDGTLLGSDGIPQKNLEKLRYFLDNGGLFTVSTGRNHNELNSIEETLVPFAQIPFSICNGSVLYDIKTKEFINPQYLEIDHLQEVVDYIRTNFADKLNFHSISDKTGFVRPENGILPPFHENSIFKILFWTQADAIRDIHANASAKFSDYFTFTIAGPRNFEVVPRGGSKKFQFSYLKEHYGVSEIWAIGDYDNDIEMLAGADFSACPSNATDTVKAVADFKVCSCGEGALAELIDIIAAKIDEKNAKRGLI